jgi:hypothetical protein
MTTLKPGQVLTGDSVKALKAGDLLRARRSFSNRDVLAKGDHVLVESVGDDGNIVFTNLYRPTHQCGLNPDWFVFVNRPVNRLRPDYSSLSTKPQGEEKAEYEQAKRDFNNMRDDGSIAQDQGALQPSASVPTEQAETAVVAAWRSGDEAPAIPRGSVKSFVVAVYRAHSSQNYTFAAEYLNAMELDWDEDGDNRLATKTGWFMEIGEDQDFYRPLTLGKDDRFLGWTDLPTWPATPAIAKGGAA